MLETKTLFYIVLILSLVFAHSSQGHSYILSNGKLRRNFYAIPFVISCAIPWYMLSFTNIGVDYPNYYQIINEIELDNYATFFFVEPGFALISALLKNLSGGNIDAVLFIFKTFAIVGAFVSIYLMRNRLNVFYSVFAYMLLLFIPSFYLISQSMASTIVLLSISIFYRTKKPGLFFMLLFVGGFIHNSVFIFLPIAILIYYLYRTELTKNKRILTILIYITILLLATSVYGYLLQNVSAFHYVNYGDYKTEGTGLYFFVLYLPLFYVVYIVSKFEQDKLNGVLIFIFILSSALFRLLSYQFKVIERMEFLLLANYIFCLPIFIDNQLVSMFSKQHSYSKMSVIYFLYILYIGYGVIEERTSANVDMAIYVPFNPFAN